KQPDNDKAQKLLNEFSVLLIDHFGSEEKYMTMSNFPDRAEHVQYHRQFLTNFILNRKKVFSRDNPMDLNALSREIAGHINTMDKKVTTFMIDHQWPTR
ncbi:MAG: hemerythrin family protein, partial [Magnetococcales bacterium]|nr:hemerythrin family protein [Magnetococcales bacterium]